MPGIEPVKRVRGASANDIDERSLVEAAQRDASRFAEIYQRYFELVYAYIVRRVRDRAVTEDLTSEVFRKALANLPRFKWTGAPFGAWLLRIASNLIADRAKRKRVAREDQSHSIEELPDRGASGSAQAQQSDLEEAERRAWVIRLVEELPEIGR